MINVKKIIFFSLILTSSLAIQGQEAKLKKANKKFNNLAYINAIKIYEDVANKGYKNADLYRKLADAKYYNAEYIDAAKWYSKLFDLEAEQTPEYTFKYGQSLKSIGDYNKADFYLKKYFEKQKIPYTNSEQFYNELKKEKERFKIKKVTFNSENSDYPAYYTNNILYVVTGNSSGKKTPWNNEPTSDIFIEKENQLESIKGNINTKYNEGSLVISKDGNTMYFTRNNYIGGKKGKDSDKTIRLKLYRAYKKNGEWTNIEELPFNSDEYSIGHPALSLDNKKLYFISDKKDDNKGETDIYEVEILSDSTFSTPINMKKINTSGKEMFPFVDTKGNLYFSSNGHPNLGGLDIFVAKANENGVYQEIQNIGIPINSKFDDFAFFMGHQKGYFASNRPEAQKDDIYSFEYEPPCSLIAEGVVFDKKTRIPINNTTISILNINNEIIKTITLNETSKYKLLDVDCDKAKFIRVEKEEYLTNEVTISKPENGIMFNQILLEKQLVSTKLGTDIGILLNPIYFDLDKSLIRSDAAIELEKIVSIMTEHPNIKIDVRSHTDSRATARYNISLSDRRAKSTIAYLIKRGITPNRLTGAGYGETQLVNKCSDGVKCSNEEHQANRRSEFIIVE